VFVPAGTPAAIVARLNAEVGKAIADPALRKNLEDSAQEPVGGTAAAFAKLVDDDYAKFEKLVKELNIKVN
jgi:tripartite-type tricarboxylate transporter receptor subunit TctC